jgi:glycosyltransferase involved in cell wall biosynthesis
MKIVISTILSTKRMVGVAEYLKNLIEHLQRIDNENEYYILTFTQNRYMFNLWNNKFREIIIPVYDLSRTFLRLNYFVWQLINFAAFIKKNNIDLIHFPCPWMIPKNTNSIVTIHDLVEYRIKKYNRINNFIKKKIIRISIKNSKKIISVSNYTAKDLLKTFRVSSTVIYNGVNKNTFYTKRTLLNVMRKYNLIEKEYFLFIGTQQKHKNINNLIIAFSIFIQENKNIKLILIGGKDNDSKRIENHINKYKLSESVKILGYLNEDEKNIILQEANCLFYPSLYEGFGFPILDAQLRNVPVVTSNIASMPEIAGAGAILVNPQNPHEIAEAMKNIFSDPKLRQELITEGNENIKRFSWKECVEKTYNSYYEML